ncbi:alpha/beta-hydrolase [Rhizoclosmatium globosum]|uniref:Alpha/beta-hydrolase n=1 Tax=Rhizoclosmatium globosum TaxID=329046 RepID=A0A1Y2B0T3_9FUNG|nr:alpha/beta-hydrolase [Rhizoclosmatium globosum]|eukprot:ORY28431.1 alpha/beta-hydrolase [Rhizoclosmatium globosum]
MTNSSVPYGRFTSPISADALASAGIRIPGLIADKKKGVLYHIEGRPSEDGRSTLVLNAVVEHPLLATYNISSSVHEYGGAPATVFDGVIVFTDSKDKRVYVVKGGDKEVCAVTPVDAVARYADFDVHPSKEFVVAVQESHLENGDVVNKLVIISLTGDITEPKVVAAGNDFYAAPRQVFSPDGKNIVWIEWSLPEMPWTKSSLHLADVEGTGSFNSPRIIASGDFSVSQPRWSTANDLYFASDETGYYNLYRHILASGQTSPLVSTPFQGDFSFPDWTLGQHKYDFLSSGNIVAGHHNKDGTGSISLIDPVNGVMKRLVHGQIVDSLVTVDDRVYIVAGTPTSPLALSQVLLNDTLTEVVEVKELKTTTEGLKGLNIEEWVSVAEAIEFPTEKGLTAFGFFYGPKNPNHSATGLPPLIVLAHGGPTAASDCILSPAIQFWTSRGFAVFDVNYGGSSGFGREYRDRLNGQWGIVDVDDVCNGALYLAGQGRVDRDRMCITGGSAGGFTTLAALAFRPDVFAVGASKYGISDLKSLAELTHKFESKYLDLVLGTVGMEKEEVEKIYRERSPIHHVGKIRAPLLVLQGSKDRVVPEDQAEAIVRAINAKGGIVQYELFEGEGHGWKMANTIKKSVEAELRFYLKHLHI